MKRRLVLAVLTLALLARLVPAIAMDNVPGRFDSPDYHRHAVSIADGNGYPEHGGDSATALRPPLYPYMLGGIYAVAGDSPRAGRAVQALLGTVAVALIGLIAASLWGRRVGFVALVLAAAYPPLVTVSAFLISEPLFLALELGSIFAVLRLREAGNPLRWALLAGVLAGLAALTRGNGVVLLLPLAIGAWSSRPLLSWRAAGPPATLLLAAALTVAPWTIRNAIELDSFVPVSTQAGFNLAGTYNDTTRHDPRHPGYFRVPWSVPEYHGLFEPLFAGEPWDEVAAEREMRSTALEYIRDHPAYVAEVIGRNSLRLLHLSGESFDFLGRERYRFGDVDVAGLWLLGVLAVAGAFMAAARRAPAFFWLVPVLMWLSVVTISGSDRFRAPVDPFIVMLASLAVASLASTISRRAGPTAGKSRS